MVIEIQIVITNLTLEIRMAIEIQVAVTNLTLEIQI